MLARGHLIIIKRDGSDGSIYPVTTPTCSVGRGVHSDIRIHVQSISQEHCTIFTSDFQPAVLKNLSSTNPTKVNNVSIHENEHCLEHGDVITTGERSFRWEYLPQSRYYMPTKTKNARPLSTSPLCGSTGMVGMPMSVLQSTLGSQPFSRRSVVVAEKKIKLSPALMASNGQSPSKRLVAVVSPQRRPQSEKKAAGTVTNVSSPADTSVVESRNQPSTKNKDPAPSKKEYSKSAMKAAVPDVGAKMFSGKRSWQALVTSRKAPLVNSKGWKSGGSVVSRVSRIPAHLKSASKLLSAKTPQSSKKSKRSCGNLKMKNPVSSVKKTKYEQKVPFTVSDEEKKRKLESGLRSAERAAKKLKLESPKTPDKNKMAALLVCHGKVSRPKTPQFVSSFPQQVADTLKVESKSGIHTPTSKSPGSAVRKTARKISENLQPLSGDKVTSANHVYSMEIPTDFNFASNTVDQDVSFGQKVKERALRSSQKSRRIRTLKLEALSPELEETVNISGIAELSKSPANVTSKWKIASITSGDTGNTPTTEGNSSGISAHYLTPDCSGLQIGICSDKKTPKHSVQRLLSGKLLKKSLQSKSSSSSEDIKNAETHQSCLSTPRAGRKSRCVSLSSPETSDQKNETSSSRKSGILSVKPDPKYGSPESVESASRSPPETRDKGMSVSRSTPASKVTASVRKSRSSVVIQSSEAYESDSRSPTRTGDKGKSVSSSSPASERTASAGKLRGSRVVMQSPKAVDSRSSAEAGGTGNSVTPCTSAYKQSASAKKTRDTSSTIFSPKAVDQNSTSTGLTFSRSSARRDHEVIPTLDSSLSMQLSFPNAVGNLSSKLDEESHGSPNSRFLKSSKKHVHRLSRSGTSVNSVSTQNSVLLQESDISYEYKISPSKKRVSESYGNQTLLQTPDSLNTTFDFDSVKTPHIPVEDFVSPLSSSRKRKSLSLQVVSNGHNVQKLMKMSPNISLSRVHEFAKNSGMLKSRKNDLVDVSGVQQLSKTQSSPKSPKNDLRDVRGVKELLKTPKSPKSPKNDLSEVRDLRNLMETPRSPKSPKNDLSYVCGVKKLMKTPKSPKSPKNDLSDVRGVRKLMKTPRNPKSPKNDLRDVRGVKQLMKTPKSPKSPKNDLSDVRGVRRLMKTPRSPKSPKNDLSDVCGVKRLMKSPKTVNSPLNDLTDVCGVRRLMTTPRVNKSPKNDLSDVHGVKELMETPRSPRSATNNVTDIDVLQLGKTLTTNHLEFGKPKSESLPVSGEVPSMATRTRHRQASGKTTPIKQSPKFIKTEVHEADRSGSEVYADQENVHLPEEVKTSNERSRRKRKEPDCCTLKAEIADGSPKPLSKKQRQKEEKKIENDENLSPGSHVSAGSTDTSLASGRTQNRVRFNVHSSPATPVARVTRSKRGMATAEVKLPSPPPETRKTLRSKRNLVKTESATAFEKAKEDTSDLHVSSPPVRKTRGKKLTSAVEISLSPARRMQQDEIAADTDSVFPLKRKRCTTVTVEVESPLLSKRQRGTNAETGKEKLFPAKSKQRGTVNTGSELSSPPKVHQGSIVIVDTIPSFPRRRRGMPVPAEVEIPQSPVTRKTKGKLTVTAAVTSPVVSTVPVENQFSTTSKQSPTNSSPLPAAKRGKQETKPVKPPSPVPARKLRGTKLSEEEAESSDTKTRKKKTRVISSPLSEAKSSPTTSKRGKKKVVSPHATTERQTRACRRKK